MKNMSIYQDIANRTGGDIYLGVVGPVRTGKSTFIKRFLEQLVIPQITDPYRQQRTKDELPQSGSGKTIMTAEPKFIPEEAVKIEPDDGVRLNVRLIDSVGYLIPGVSGDREEDGPRMVTTPWVDHEIPMAEAAELGTKKVMADHCTVGVVITTDGTVTEFPRESYAEAEERAIRDMQATGKPYVVIVNSAQPDSETAQSLCQALRKKWQAVCVSLDCQAMTTEQIHGFLRQVLFAFPVGALQFYLPGWMEALEDDHPLKTQLYQTMLRMAEQTGQISQAKAHTQMLADLEAVDSCTVERLELGTGTVCYSVRFPSVLFYQILGEKSGFSITCDGDLMNLLAELASVKRSYDKIAAALEEVNATGYGVVMPTMEDMQLTPPEIVKKGSNYAVRMKAQAPSIHMIRTDVQADITPLVGDENQTRDLVTYLETQSEGDPEKLWQSNIFGRSVFALVSDGLNSKLHRLPEQVRQKFKGALTRVINDGNGGLICILL